MGLFSHRKEDEEAANQYKGGEFENSEYKKSDHSASKVHEGLAAAAAFYAAHEYEKTHDPNSDHKFAKEALAGLAGGFIDGEIEGRGYNAYKDYRNKDRNSEFTEGGLKELAQNKAQNYYNKQNDLPEDPYRADY